MIKFTNLMTLNNSNNLQEFNLNKT